MGAWANHRHLTAQDVDKLGQLVEAELSDDATDARDSGIARHRQAAALLVTLFVAHAAELQHPDQPATIAIAPLHEEQRPGAFELDG